MVLLSTPRESGCHSWAIWKHLVARQSDLSKVTEIGPLEAERNSLSNADLPERIIELEMAVAHLEHELGQMHSVLLAVQADLKSSREQISKLERRVILASEPQEERDPLDERPPHY